MSLATPPWIVAVILGLLALSPAHAGMTPEEVKALEGYKAQAKKGDPVGEYNLGFCYHKGYGVFKDDVEAVKWYRKAAEQGNANAQTNLGTSFYTGEGVAKNQVEAVKWWRKAADQGDAAAQHNLGNSYYTGNGVVKNQVEAYAYYNLAGITIELAREKLNLLEKILPPEAVLRGQQRTMELQKEIETKMAAKQAVK